MRRYGWLKKDEEEGKSAPYICMDTRILVRQKVKHGRHSEPPNLRRPSVKH